MTFGMSFLMKVVELPPAQAGVVFLTAQLTDAFISPINGYLGDHVQIPFISKKIGRKKSWHLVGTILIAVATPQRFNRCLLCDEVNGVSWLPTAYFAFVLATINIGYSMMEINHLSIISTVSETIQEATTLNTIRNVFTYVSGIYVYMLAWGLFGQGGDDNVGPDSLTQFLELACIVCGTGVVFSIIFYVGTKEPNTDRPPSTLIDSANVGSGQVSESQSLYSMAFEKADDGPTKMTHQSQPETSVAAIKEEYEHDLDACQHVSNELEKTEEMEEHCESTDTGKNERDRATSWNACQQKETDMSMIAKDAHQLGISNLGYQNENIGTEIRREEEVQMPPTTSSFKQEDLRERAEIKADSIDVTCNKKPKTIKNWITDPHLYKVALVVTCSRLVQDVVYTYLPLYLIESLEFGKQSIAYFPLVLVVSAALANIVLDKLNTKIGGKWTYLLASLLVIGASVYCYFQTPALRQSTYAPVIMIGSGMSIMYVMSLVFATALIGEDKETSGSVFAIIVFMGRISSGGMVMAIQEFYPQNDSEASDYVRHVFAMVPGMLALTASLVVLFIQSPYLCSTRKEYSPTEDTHVQTEASTTSADVVVISGKKASYISHPL